MFRLDLLVLVLFGDADGFLNGFLAANRESIESHLFILNRKMNCEWQIFTFAGSKLITSIISLRKF